MILGKLILDVARRGSRPVTEEEKRAWHRMCAILDEKLDERRRIERGEALRERGVMIL
jgi:hypothetical protein